MTRIGDLNRRFELQSPTRTSDGAGGFRSTFVAMATVWGKRTPHQSDEAIQAMAQTGRAVHTIRIRYRTDIRADWRIKEGDKYFNIVGVPLEVERRRWLDIKVEEAA